MARRARAPGETGTKGQALSPGRRRRRFPSRRVDRGADTPARIDPPLRPAPHLIRRSVDDPRANGRPHPYRLPYAARRRPLRRLSDRPCGRWFAVGDICVPTGAGRLGAPPRGRLPAASRRPRTGPGPAGGRQLQHLLPDRPGTRRRALRRPRLRAAQLEGGIFGGRVYLASYALGLGASGLTFIDDDVIDFFSPDAAGKSVMFLMAVGRPAGRTSGSG